MVAEQLLAKGHRSHSMVRCSKLDASMYLDAYLSGHSAKVEEQKEEEEEEQSAAVAARGSQLADCPSLCPSFLLLSSSSFFFSSSLNPSVFFFSTVCASSQLSDLTGPQYSPQTCCQHEVYLLRSETFALLSCAGQEVL